MYIIKPSNHLSCVDVDSSFRFPKRHILDKLNFSLGQLTMKLTQLSQFTNDWTLEWAIWLILATRGAFNAYKRWLHLLIKFSFLIVNVEPLLSACVKNIYLSERDYMIILCEGKLWSTSPDQLRMGLEYRYYQLPIPVFQMKKWIPSYLM